MCFMKQTLKASPRSMTTNVSSILHVIFTVSELPISLNGYKPQVKFQLYRNHTLQAFIIFVRTLTGAC